MYAPVKACLEAQGWQVRAEVEGADAAAMRDGRLLMAEMKLTLNLDVVLQAVGRQRTADVVYIAVPRKNAAMRTQRWRDTLDLLKRLNLGLIVVSCAGGRPDAEELIEPAMPDAPVAKGRAVHRRVRAVRELNGRSGDFNTGGVHGQKLMTAYREAALRVAAKLENGGPMSAKRLKPDGETSRRTYMILKNNHYNWFRPTGNALFELTDEGRAALAVYGGVLSCSCTDNEYDDVFSGTVIE